MHKPDPAPPEPRAATDAAKLGYIDAVRGWAILLVITSHVGGRFAELPYPVKKLTNFGWTGVQMFFLASAVTLMMSWQRNSRAGPGEAANFYIRRFLRIAPMYYCGALLYFLVDPPATGFDLSQLMRSLLFINAWHPEWIPTTPGWHVVPGGWSIGVEFTFYACFPALAWLLTTLARALVFWILAIFAAILANAAGGQWFGHYDTASLSNFLYFWFPNQLPIFAAGMVLYHLLKQDRFSIPSTGIGYCLIGIIVVVCILLAENPTSITYFHSLTRMPTVFWATVAYLGFIFILAKGPEGVFAHPWMRKLGVLSFSCYVLHFFFVDRIPIWTAGLVDVQATGVHAIWMFMLLWLLAVCCTVAAALLAHRFVEQPGIELARRLIARRRKFRAAPA